MGVFGQHEVRLDPWQVDYGPVHPLESPVDEPAVGEVDCDVEVPLDRWRPVTVTPAPLADWTFIDGVRRVEAHVVLRAGDAMVAGVFGSYAVGAVRTEPGAARIVAERIGRHVIFGAGHTLAGPVALGRGLTYTPLSTAGDEVDAPVRGLHGQMRAAEERLACELASAGSFVVLDGPLSFGQPPVASIAGSVVGFVKRLHRLYVPAGVMGLLAGLDLGQRTPIFAIRGSKRFARYSWFQRLARKWAVESPLAGVVRLEVPESAGLAAARTIADRTTDQLPRFVPSRGRDPRAPQNLLPVGALETQLRHHLGDVQLISRRVRDLISRESPS